MGVLSAFRQSDVVGVGVRVLSLLAIALPTLGTLVIIGRAAQQVATRAWRRTEGRPVRRGLAGLVAAGLVAGLAWAWWPDAGAYRPIRLVTRPGSLMNVKHPGPSVGGNTETHPHIQNVVLRALAGAVPDRVQAGEGASSCNFLFGGFHPEYGDYYTNYHIEGSGWGGTIDHDGNNVLCPNNGNCRNTPVEILETKYPFIVEEYKLRPDSAGAGRWRGGLASSRGRAIERTAGTFEATYWPGRHR